MALANEVGIEFEEAADNTIGGTEAEPGNVISGNTYNEVLIEGLGSASNVLVGNFIGTDFSGSTPLGNVNGVVISNVPDNTIGGGAVGARNVISANQFDGVRIGDTDSTGNVVLGKSIGTDVSGTTAVANDQGVEVTRCPQHDRWNCCGGWQLDLRQLVGVRLSERIRQATCC